MESCSLQSPAITTVPSSLSRSGFIEKPLGYGRILKLPACKKYPHGRKLKFFDFRAQASACAVLLSGNAGFESNSFPLSETTKISSEMAGTISNKADSKDEDLAFVAGATGRVGSRTVRELLKLGFRVRAGVRSAQKAETLVQSVKQLKLDPEGTTPSNRQSLFFRPAVEKLEIVECDLEKQDTIAPAIGNASVVICCIGASEKEIFDITGPYRIDYQATKNLIDAGKQNGEPLAYLLVRICPVAIAAITCFFLLLFLKRERWTICSTAVKVNHFILVSSLGTNKVGFPAAILNLFWGVLIWKRKAEEVLIASGLPYTIVRPGGMERPTDAFKETHNITLSTEDTLFGGLVSNLQVAELMACMARNRSLSYCKVVEVVAETTAPLRPMEELLAKIPSQRADISSPKCDVSEVEMIFSRLVSHLYEEQEYDTPTKPDPAPARSIVTEKPTTPTEKEPAQAKVLETEPLSPYTVYDDLKPPSSPSPTPDGPKEVSSSASAPAENVSTSTEGNSVPAAVATDITEKDSSKQSTSRSPYYAYADLKPPTSPSPRAPRTAPADSGSKGDTLSGNSTAQSLIAEKPGDEQPDTKPTPRPLSPFAMYADLKPPSTPSPRAPTTAPVDSGSEGATFSGNSTAQSSIADKPSHEQHNTKPTPRPLSPFAMYADLKPPSTPSPRAPTTAQVDSGSEGATLSGNSTAQSSIADKPSDEQHNPKPRLLSPFAMYEDLKPPTSPIPSPKKS
ncbi:Protein TIC 62, chloroplastic [Gossypium australe]|uniref:Protein TIC 62, chloroplastic n=1 Tax=Gossypium australe TaxID=47621 RepID=A0A5B6WUP1_9ROSI|nr:Protein TIC 62, chloroplastic [Gossypium australe]